jgi:signal transduction histidine kinase
MNPFFTTKPVNAGTGLGLSISHGIVKDHGGDITIESRTGEFTRVIIDFPAIQGNGEGDDRRPSFARHRPQASF